MHDTNSFIYLCHNKSINNNNKDMENRRFNSRNRRENMYSSRISRNANANSNNRRIDKGGTRVGHNQRGLGRDIPSHLLELAYIIKGNQAIRRYTGLNILNVLQQKKIIINAPDNFVDFKWDKFTVCSNGLRRDYKYSEQIFIDCLVAAFKQFAEASEKVVNNFIDIENAIKAQAEHKKESDDNNDNDDSNPDDSDK